MAMNFLVSNKNKTINIETDLPASKSISNRALIINALSDSAVPVNNLSDSDDTQVLKKALYSNDTNKFDIGHAGTAMRFLTAYLTRIAGEWEVTGSSRMKQRPISILVNALNKLGGNIQYMEKHGFPPLKIYGSHLTGTTLEMDGSVSSQYISALLMIAPVIDNGLELKLKGEITSRSYIEMTLKLMAGFGIKYVWTGDTITIPEQTYKPLKFTVESDWSAASYWYEILALSDNGSVFLKNLKLDSLQGDAKIATWFEDFGIKSIQKNNGILITKDEEHNPDSLTLNFIENPDIAQTMACLCVAKKIPFHFLGLKTLKIKETDRIAALKNELSKFGASLSEPIPGELKWTGTIDQTDKDHFPLIKTYNDHRMAMSFAPLAIAGLKMEIENPSVVSKSYPAFWSDLEKAGFQITSTNK
jgi:3-phosphoshikimate 1-carboxyvinyltransferase